MKKKITRILTATMLAVMMVFTAIPFASAATNNNALDETKKVSFTLNCSKPGYTFTVYKVAELKTTENPYKTGYDSLIPSISDEILSGKTSNVLSALDGLSSIPSTASTVGTFTTSATSVKNTSSKGEKPIFLNSEPNCPLAPVINIFAINYKLNVHFPIPAATTETHTPATTETFTTIKRIAVFTRTFRTNPQRKSPSPYL